MFKVKDTILLPPCHLGYCRKHDDFKVNEELCKKFGKITKYTGESEIVDLSYLVYIHRKKKELLHGDLLIETTDGDFIPFWVTKISNIQIDYENATVSNSTSFIEFKLSMRIDGVNMTPGAISYGEIIASGKNLKCMDIDGNVLDGDDNCIMVLRDESGFISCVSNDYLNTPNEFDDNVNKWVWKCAYEDENDIELFYYTDRVQYEIHSINGGIVWASLRGGELGSCHWWVEAKDDDEEVPDESVRDG